MSTVQYNAQALNGDLTHPMTNTNRLLRVRSDVLGGKTGYSEAAGYNMITVFRAPNGHRLVTVVLGADDSDSRFDQTNRIIEWVYNAYRW